MILVRKKKKKRKIPKNAEKEDFGLPGEKSVCEPLKVKCVSCGPTSQTVYRWAMEEKKKSPNEKAVLKKAK